MKIKSCAAVSLMATFLAVAAAQDSLPKAKSLQKLDYRIGFSLTPDSVIHQGNEGIRAAIVDPTSQTPTVNLLNTPYVPVGTQFAGWLRDGNVLLTTTHTLKTTAGATVFPLVVDSYVVNPKTGRIKYCLTCGLHSNQSTDYLYSQTPQPIYDSPQTKNVSYYVVTTHLGTINVEGTGTLTEVWTVGPDGKNGKPFLDFRVGMHGCQISPDAKWLACEPANRKDPTKPQYCWDGVMLVLIKGRGLACVGNTDEYSRDSVAIWSPDSKGFVYFSQTKAGDLNHPTNGWLNYYALATGVSTPTLRLANGTVPTYFCNQFLSSPCTPVGRGPSWSPCEAAKPCPNEHGVSKWLFLSVYYPPAGSLGARQVIGKVSLDKPDEFIPVTEELGLDAGYPMISPDGTRIAFLAVESSTDSRRQLYTMSFNSCKTGFKSCKFTKLTSFTSESFTNADTPQWPTDGRH
jgi:hypothetical protein